MIFILIGLLVLDVMIIGCCNLQMYRSWLVYWIRNNWINNKEFERLEKYSYNYMFKPNRRNWFGFKMPHEKDYK